MEPWPLVRAHAAVPVGGRGFARRPGPPSLRELGLRRRGSLPCHQGAPCHPEVCQARTVSLIATPFSTRARYRDSMLPNCRLMTPNGCSNLARRYAFSRCATASADPGASNGRRPGGMATIHATSAVPHQQATPGLDLHPFIGQSMVRERTGQTIGRFRGRRG